MPLAELLEASRPPRISGPFAVATTASPEIGAGRGVGGAGDEGRPTVGGAGVVVPPPPWEPCRTRTTTTIAAKAISGASRCCTAGSIGEASKPFLRFGAASPSKLAAYIRSVVKGSPVRNRRGPATVTGRGRRGRLGASHWGRHRALGKARPSTPEARRPAPGQPCQPSRKGWLQCPNSSHLGWPPRARWPSLSPSRPRRSPGQREAASPPICGYSPPAERCSPKRRCAPAPRRSRPAPRRPASGRGAVAAVSRRRSRGATALGLLAQAAKSDSALRPLLVSDHFSFGLALCGVGGKVAKGEGSWYLTVNHVTPKSEGKRRSCIPVTKWSGHLAGLLPLSRRAGAERARQGAGGEAVRGARLLLRRKGKRRPAAGSRSAGPAAPLTREGRATVTLSKPALLIARHGGEIPSNREAVCVGGRCPSGSGR